jgi:catechol 2,3-dioxygenase-like lactoylglutathione lyase family enzyme
MRASEGGHDSSPNVFADTTVASVVLRVRDLEQSIEWYREKFGLTPIAAGEDGPAVAYVINSLVVALWQLPPGEQRERADNDRNTGLTFVVDDLDAKRAELEQRGIECGVTQRSAHHAFFWCHDPDHNRFEFSDIRGDDAHANAEAARSATAP